jgi:hypothetical protein
MDVLRDLRDPDYILFWAVNAMNAVNSDTGSALSPGFSGQCKIEPHRYEQTNRCKNQVSKLNDKPA